MEENNVQEQPAAKGFGNFIKKSWKMILLGIVMMGFGVYEYKKFFDFEINGGTMSVYSVEKILYNTCGIWGNCLFFELIGIGLIVFTIYSYTKK
jgi:hypothetical protein